jgi:hypothetical protein
MKIHPLIRALNGVAPKAGFAIIASNDWCSMTFAGEQLTIKCTIDNENYLQHYSNLADILSEYEFTIAHMLVADIAVVSQKNTGDEVTLLIEALVLDA